ncbi:MAG: histidine--tRNA ligase [Candidatus Latescibacteria bacterium]|nr:histidine--tRNA ligase [Candidatus Latescibacterota bacterium]
MKFQVPRGTRDILPGEVERWLWLEDRTRRTLALYGYREVRTPIFEATELFVRSVGEATDIVRKELYTFQDRKGRSLTLRPEGTAPLVRAYIENAPVRAEIPARLYYMGPMFRYERPQAGRYRQFWQIGAELLGSAKPEADAEMIDLFRSILWDVGLRDVIVLLNSLGDSVCRPRYREAIRAYFMEHQDALCGDCRERLDTNPLRILDCKVPSCAPVIARAPSVLESLCGPCAEHFAAVKRALDGLGIRNEEAPRLVRGLDYYTRTVFEIQSEGLGAQNAVGGGGRYDQLVKDFGGPDTPAIGFSIGMERLLLATESSGESGTTAPDACVVALEPGAALEAQILARRLRGQDDLPEGRKPLRVLVDVAGRSASSQMKWASKTGARWAVFVPKQGDGYAVRDMAAGKDEAKQPTDEALREWLLARIDRGEPREALR